MTSEQQAIIDAGAQAFRDGASLQSDPYPRGSAESRLWRDGWMSAVHAA